MIAIRRRLFWKIYLTLLFSLVAVALSMGCFWWFLGEAQGQRWSAPHIHFAAKGSLEPSGPVQAAGGSTGQDDGTGADVSFYERDGTLVASHGRPIPFPRDDGAAGWEGRRTLRVDLPGGRIVLTRQRPLAGAGWRILAAMLVVAGGVGLAAFPVTARLTRRLETLRSGMARWGDGELSMRVDETGSDEVALVARTFNAAAGRVDALLASQQALLGSQRTLLEAQRTLLANASHELRSPLARLRMAVELWLQNPAAATHAEIVRGLAEIDGLVGEILLSSRLDHPSPIQTENVDLLGLAAEEAVRFDAAVLGEAVEIEGDARLLRRLLRNLLENAARHGQPPVQVVVSRQEDRAVIAVSDQGQGIAPEERERVFEPFHRPAGRNEAGGGWGLGLALVQQIARRHGGQVTCEGSATGGSRFVVHLPAARGLHADQARVAAIHGQGAPARQGVTPPLADPRDHCMTGPNTKSR